MNGGPHIHGPLGIGGNFIINTPATGEINMDAVGSYVFPGDGATTTGLLVKGGITWTTGNAKVLSGKYIHIGSSTGSIQSDNGTNMATQILPTATTYNNAKRIEGTIDQTPSPAVFQSVGLDFNSLFTSFRSIAADMALCANSVQLQNASGVDMVGNVVSTPQNVQINSLATGVNHLDLTSASLANITELKFGALAAPSATKLLVISVPLTANLVWNNANMPSLSGSANGPYIIWNFYGTTSYNLTINSASLLIGTVFAPNHNLIKTGTGDIDGNLVAKTITMGLGEIHYYPFAGNVPSCSPAPCATTVFFTENFGTGARTSHPYTNYCYEDSTGNDCLLFAPSVDINDGEYAVAQFPKPTSANHDWTTDGDHTGNLKGRMMVVNADLTPGEFYRRTITGLVPNVDVTVDLWLRNSILPGYNLLKPNVTFKLENTSNVVLGSISTGDIPEDNTWKNYVLSLNPGNTTSVTVVLVNNGPGGVGNDLALDDIVAKQILTPPAPTVSATCASPTSTLTITSPIGASFQYSINGTTYQAGTSFAGLAAGTYSVTVKNTGSGCISTSTSMTISGLPVISAQPVGATICTSSTHSLSVTASGATAYQWQSSSDNVSFTNIAGATASTYTTGTLTTTTYYQVLVTNSTCSLTSGKATVTVQACTEICDNGLDDDGDGLVDCADSNCTATSYATAVYSQTGVVNPNNTLGAPNAVAAQLYDTNDKIVLDLGAAKPAGTTVTIRWRRGTSTTSNPSMAVAVSANASTFTAVTGSPFSLGSTTYFNTTITLAVSSRYLRITSSNTYDADLDAVTVAACLVENCTNGLDDDGDGSVDCADNQCPLPTAGVSGTNSICAGSSTTLTATGGGTYAWSNGATTSAITVTPASTTTYTVTVTKANGCTATASRTVTVNASPAALISGTNSLCPGGSTTLTASGGTYAWSTGATTAAITVTPASTTTYTVTVTNAATCTATASSTVTINPLPTAGITGSTTLCAGTSTTLTASGGASYVWSTGATAANTSVTPSSTTTYAVTVTSASGCTATASHTVTVNAIPAASISGTNSICVGTSTSLTASGGGTYVWSTGATTAGISATPVATTTYGVTVTNIAGCTATASQTVTVNALPTAGITGTNTVCAGTSTSLTASGGTYVWSTGATSAAISVSPAVSTTYTVTVTNASGCTATAASLVTVNSTPVAEAGANSTVCSGTSATLSASATGGITPYSFAWSNSLGSGSSKTVTPLASTTYTVTVTGNNGCTATDQATVSVNAKPTASAGTNKTICNGSSTTLTATASGGVAPLTYNWSNGLGGTATVTAAPLATTTYTVTVTSANGCIGTSQITITVQNCSEICGNGLDDDSDGLADCADSDCGPVADLGTNISICGGTSTLLSVSVTGGGSGALTFAWSNGLGLGQTKTVAPVTTTTYSVTVTAPSGCTSTAVKTVTVANCSENCTDNIDNDSDGLVDCADTDCAGITAPVLVNDSYTTCPGIPYSERVTYNDGNLQSPAFSIVANPAFGVVTIDATGKFIYTPLEMDCQTDQFSYQVCNQVTGCCSQANVSIHMGDNTSPVLTNVPADITIGCDDRVPDPSVVTAFDQCPGVLIGYQEYSDQHAIGACESFTITRTWTATDLCGNTVTDDQKINVLDQTKPEIFQVYTLENGKRLIAGVAQRVTQYRKYVPFPVNFNQAPVVFTQVVTANSATPVISRLRNVTQQGFEVNLQEEEAADGVHGNESIAWLAIEPGALDGNIGYEAGVLSNVSHLIDTLVYAQGYDGAPILFSSIMTANETDATTIRHTSQTASEALLYLQEETSLDVETIHAHESMGFMAIKAGQKWKDGLGQSFGETGTANITNAWATLSFAGKYTKPVVIVGGLSANDAAPVTIRVRNVNSTGFQMRAEEWAYLDGNHAAESVSWMVVEGSIPGNQGYYCAGKANLLKPNVNVFAMDNCDDLVSFGYTETESEQASGLLTTRTWIAIDDCGNTSIVSRYDTCSYPALTVKALVYGAMLGSGNGQPMRDDLRIKGLVPVQEPFTGLNGFSNVFYDHEPTEPEVLVAICHKPGTASQEAMQVPESELALHLAHGDQVGACSDNSNGMVTICHKPGTNAQKTLTIPQSALSAHLGHGDLIGDCANAGDGLPTGAAAAQYKTVANGNWTDAATWLGGTVPPVGNIDNKTISILHKVTMPSGGIVLKNGAKLWVTRGSLTLQTGDFKIEKGDAVFTSSTFVGAPNGIFEMNNSLAVLKTQDCVFDIGGDFVNQGGKRSLRFTSMKIGGDFINFSGKDTLINVCANIAENVSNTSIGADLYMENVKLRLANGSFWNNLPGKVAGDSIVILAEGGSLRSLGLWTADIMKYCVSDTLSIPLGNLLGAESCLNIAQYFNPCDCYHGPDEEDNNAGNSDDEAENAGNSEGDGTIDPQLLVPTGPTAVVDWMLLELRDPDDDKEIMGYATVLVQRDGQIVGEDGNSVIKFTGLVEGEYYVSVRHRNHLGMMTDEPIYLSSGNPPLVDFTSADLPVRGGSWAGKNNGGLRTMWAGDLNGDGKVVYQGPYNDVFFLFTRILGDETNQESLANFIVNGYERQDLNLDGKVIYQGPGNDRSTLLYHSVLGHPGNGSLLANFIVQGLLP